MLSPVTVALALLVLLTQAAVPPPTPVPVPAPSTDPATSIFTAEAGLMLVAIKPLAIADYELVITTLNAALAKDTDATRVAAAKGWRVFKATPADAKGNALYIHLMAPAVPGFDYRPSQLVDALVKDLAPELLSTYQDAFAGPPSKLDLTELANMALAAVPAPPKPVTPPDVKKPGGR